MAFSIAESLVFDGLVEKIEDVDGSYWDKLTEDGHAFAKGCWAIALCSKQERADLFERSKYCLDRARSLHPMTARNSLSDHRRRTVEGSLKRLRTDYIALLYQQHRVAPKVPMADVAGTGADPRREGKVRSFGVSEASARSIRLTHTVYPVRAVQSEYSLLWREPENKSFATLQELNIVLVPSYPLGRGFLTGAINANSHFTSDRLATLP